MSFQVQVTNTGVTAQTNVTLSDTPPANTILQSVQPSQGSCSGSAPVTCALGSLAASASATVTVTVVPVQPGTVTNSATAASDQASQVSSSQNGTVTAESNVTYVTVNDSGFSQANEYVPMGSIVQYNFLGTAGHDLSEGQAHLFDTGTQTPVSYYRQEFDVAAWYTINDSTTAQSNNVRIAPSAPTTGTAGQPFTVTWSAAPIPLGYSADIQVLAPGSSTWTNWQLNQTMLSTSASYTPAATGTYQFRSRLHLSGSGATAYGPAFSVFVS
jgi:uncharacterized repeat protein (TIGR01451 family)